MTVYFNKKFCWIPVCTYITKYYRNGFVWFNFAYFDKDGKAYKSAVDLVRANSVRWEEIDEPIIGGLGGSAGNQNE